MGRRRSRAIVFLWSIGGFTVDTLLEKAEADVTGARDRDDGLVFTGVRHGYALTAQVQPRQDDSGALSLIRDVRHDRKGSDTFCIQYARADHTGQGTMDRAAGTRSRESPVSCHRHAHRRRPIVPLQKFGGPVGQSDDPDMLSTEPCWAPPRPYRVWMLHPSQQACLRGQRRTAMSLATRRAQLVSTDHRQAARREAQCEDRP